MSGRLIDIANSTNSGGSYPHPPPPSVPPPPPPQFVTSPSYKQLHQASHLPHNAGQTNQRLPFYPQSSIPTPSTPSTGPSPATVGSAEIPTDNNNNGNMFEMSKIIVARVEFQVCCFVHVYAISIHFTSLGNRSGWTHETPTEA
eukprot:GHVS01043162.1.p1 GENE.GHVS01043162.1~~GHVS01043162.1.p1  ORF type:complete len:144 (+),score=24.20 GHVS01043162.1:236-667(+)